MIRRERRSNACAQSSTGTKDNGDGAMPADPSACLLSSEMPSSIGLWWAGQRATKYQQVKRKRCAEADRLREILHGTIFHGIRK